MSARSRASEENIHPNQDSTSTTTARPRPTHDECALRIVLPTTGTTLVHRLSSQIIMFRTTALSALCISLAVVANANQAQSFFAANAPSYQKHKHNQAGKSHFDANWAASLDSGLFSPAEDLRLLNEEVFTTLEHPAFLQHSVRIKQSPSGFCDDSVRCVHKLTSGILD